MRISRWLFGCGAALLLVGSGSCAARQPNGSATAGRFVDTPDMAALIRRVVGPDGLLDRDYMKLVRAPSPYYPDLFGIQPIADVSVEQIKNDFVPEHARAGGETDHSLQLIFPGGWTADFCTPCSITLHAEVGDFTIPFSHVTISGESFREFEPHLREFRSIITMRDLSARYLIPNPVYDAEVTVADRRNTGVGPASVVADPDLERFGTSDDAILIFPDNHGDIELYNDLMRLLETADYEWLALELLSAELQGHADTFVTAPEDSNAYRDARAKLMNGIWPDRFVPGTPAAANRYLKIFELLRARHKRAVGLEDVPVEYFFFGRGEIAGAGASARNVRWAERIPESGRGILFGGSGHFTWEEPLNFQDFLAERLPGMEILSVKKLPG